MTHLTPAQYVTARNLFSDAAKSIGGKVHEDIQCNCRTHHHGPDLKHPDPADEYAYLRLTVRATVTEAPGLLPDLFRLAFATDSYLTVSMPFPRGGDAPVEIHVSASGDAIVLRPQVA